jgi:hypothetical protein
MNKEFIRVSNYSLNRQKFPNEFNRFSDYLRGIPFGFLFYSSDIKEFLVGIGLEKQVEKYKDDNEKIEYLYYYLIFSEMIKVVNNGR